MGAVWQECRAASAVPRRSNDASGPWPDPVRPTRPRMPPVCPYYPATSPYARKVRIAALEKGLGDRITLHALDPLQDPPELLAANPLAKVPCLLLDDGTVLVDSPVICEYLDSLAPRPALVPAGGDAR